MAEITRSGPVGPCSFDPSPEFFFGEGTAGAAIAAGDQLYLKASDSLYYPATGAALTAPGIIVGQAARASAIGEAVTVTRGQRFWYSSGMTAGAQLYLSASVAGGLATVATTGGVSPAGYVLPDGCRVEFYFPDGIN